MNLLFGILSFNEEASVQHVIRSLPSELLGIKKMNIVLIDDGSTDRTREFGQDAGIAVISHPANLGLGCAFRTLVAEALRQEVDLLLTIDGDGQFCPESIPALIRPIVDHESEVSIGSRFLHTKLTPSISFTKRLGMRALALVMTVLTRRKFTDVTCGYRAYSRRALLELSTYSSFTYVHETLLDLTSKNIPIVEVPVLVKGAREFGEPKISKSVLSYAWRTIHILLRFHFFRASHVT